MDDVMAVRADWAPKGCADRRDPAVTLSATNPDVVPVNVKAFKVGCPEMDAFLDSLDAGTR